MRSYTIFLFLYFYLLLYIFFTTNLKLVVTNQLIRDGTINGS